MMTPNAPTGPFRECFPMENSTIRRGMDQRKRKMHHVMRRLPPPFCAAIRGKRQTFPVPTAMPRAASINPHREEKTSRGREEDNSFDKPASLFSMSHPTDGTQLQVRFREAKPNCVSNGTHHSVRSKWLGNILERISESTKGNLKALRAKSHTASAPPQQDQSPAPHPPRSQPL